MFRFFCNELFVQLNNFHYFANKGPCSQSYGFSSSQVWMWELDYKESWMLKNWCFWTVVLEKTLESRLDCKEIQPVNPKGNQFWIFVGRTEAEAPIHWPPDAKNWPSGKDSDAGKDWRQEEKGMTEDEMIGWHHWLDGHEFEQALGVLVMDRETWHALVHGVVKSWTRLSGLTELKNFHETSLFSIWYISQLLRSIYKYIFNTHWPKGCKYTLAYLLT